MNTNYTDWFVLHVRTNRERYIKKFIEEQSIDSVTVRVFSRELLFERKNKTVKIEDTLFPGYLFVYRRVQHVIEIIRKNLSSEYVKPLCFKESKCEACFSCNSPCMVKKEEMEFLLSNSDSSGVFRVSDARNENEEISILNGPLKNMTGKIIWINRKKKKACIEMALFGQRIKVNLGIDVHSRACDDASLSQLIY